MIWCAGEILPDDGLMINAADRTFEHGLGLFETMRTWNGRPTFLNAHRSRMMKSAEILRLCIDPDHFPSEQDIARLLGYEQAAGDRILRITASGGTSAGSTVWMRSKSLGKPGWTSIRIALGSWTIHRDDPLARHKTLNYWARRMALGEAISSGFDETLGLTDAGLYCEGSISNLFVAQDGELLTTSLDMPIIPGLMREFVLGLARDLTLRTREVPGFSEEALLAADEVFLTNSVRGIVPVAHAEDPGSGRVREWPAPGPMTRTLQIQSSKKLLPRETMP